MSPSDQPRMRRLATTTPRELSARAVRGAARTLSRERRETPGPLKSGETLLVTGELAVMEQQGDLRAAGL
jgi:hypothetical protein